MPEEFSGLPAVALSAAGVATLSAAYAKEGEALSAEQVEALAFELAKSGLAWMEEGDGVSRWMFRAKAVAKVTALARKCLRRPKTGRSATTDGGLVESEPPDFKEESAKANKPYDKKAVIGRILTHPKIKTMKELARFLGITPPAVSGAKDIPPVWLVKLNVGFGLRIRWMLYGTGDKYEPIYADESVAYKRLKHKRKCTICGKWFICSPSDQKKTCGNPECTSKQKSLSHMGVRNPWNDESKAALSERGQTENLKRGQPAAIESARGGPFESNANAIWWEFETPDGRTVKCRNLTKWLRDHIDELPGSVENARAGFSAMSRWQRGKTKRVASQWKGYRLIRTWIDEGSTRWIGGEDGA